MPDDQNCQIGRPVVSTVMVQLFAAYGAFVVHFKVALEQWAGPAIGALTAPTFAQSRTERALVWRF